MDEERRACCWAAGWFRMRRTKVLHTVEVIPKHRWIDVTGGVRHMKRISWVAAILTAALATSAFAGTGNGAPSGPHYNLNIIGVSNAKTAPLTNSDRHTIFVALGKSATVTSRIYLTPGPFQVCDGNAF